MSDDVQDADTIRVPKARLREVKLEIDTLRAELDALRGEHDNLRAEHDNLRAHLTGSVKEVDRLRKENAQLRG